MTRLQGLASYSVLVPVHNEAAILSSTVPALLAAADGDQFELVYVCNGCSDGSAELLKRLAGSKAQVVEIGVANKALALNAGDRMLSVFPRFYVDADVKLPRGAFRSLSCVLRNESLELTAPKLIYDRCDISALSLAVVRMAENLPHGRTDAFHCCLGVSLQGRRRWADFPNVLGDDIFIESCIPKSRQGVAHSVVCSIRAPATIWRWIGVRARWRYGEKQLSDLGMTVNRTPGQFRALIKALVTRKTVLDASCFILVRVLASVLSRLHGRNRRVWYSASPRSSQ